MPLANACWRCGRSRYRRAYQIWLSGARMTAGRQSSLLVASRTVLTGSKPRDRPPRRQFLTASRSKAGSDDYSDKGEASAGWLFAFVWALQRSRRSEHVGVGGVLFDPVTDYQVWQLCLTSGDPPTPTYCASGHTSSPVTCDEHFFTVPLTNPADIGVQNANTSLLYVAPTCVSSCPMDSGPRECGPPDNVALDNSLCQTDEFGDLFPVGKCFNSVQAGSTCFIPDRFGNKPNVGTICSPSQ